MNISVVFTGGTIGSRINEEGYISTEGNSPFKLIEIYQRYNEGTDVHFNFYEPYNILSENLSAHELNLLFSCIRELSKDTSCDGIIITHGSDTLQYTSAFLAYLFDTADIPIILIASDFPLSDSRANGLLNFSSAISFIRGGYGKGVFICYSNDNINTVFHHGTRLIRHVEYSAEMHSVCGRIYGTLSGGKFIPFRDTATKEPDIPYKDNSLPFSGDICAHLSDNSDSILRIYPYPGMTLPDIPTGTRAILFDSYHSGTLRTDEAFFEFMKKAGDLNIPCFISGVPCNEAYYETVKHYEAAGLTILPVSSGIAMYCKLYLAISNGMPLRETMLTPCAHDFISQSELS